MKRILFICENDSRNQSTKHRVLDVIAFLKIGGYRLYCGRKTRIGASSVMLLSVPDYFRILRDIGTADLLFIQRTSGIFIYFLCLYAKRRGATIVFDVDDAIFAKRIGMLKNPLYACFDRIARTSDYVFAGSHYIREYAERLNGNTLLVPTAVNTEIFDARTAVRGAAGRGDEFVIGWLGAGEIHLRSLMLLREPLRALSVKYRIAFEMVSSLGSRKIRNAFRDIAGLRIDYGRDDWMALDAIPEAMKGFDVSVMPLIDSPYARGKCSLKALESMAMRIPVVASGVGENAHIIRHGENGYLANTAEEWIRCIEELIVDETKRRRIADNGYATVSRDYTIPAVAGKIAEVLGAEGSRGNGTKINVLHVLSTNRFSGAEKIAGQICRNLNRDAFNVSILCNGGELLRRYRAEGLEAFDVNVNRYYPWNMAAFLRIVRKNRVDIVHAHGTRAAVFALACGAMAGRRYRIVSHTHGCRRWQKNRGLLSAVDGFLASRYDMNVVCGTGVYGHFMEREKRVDASKVRVISNALEIESDAGGDDDTEAAAARAVESGARERAPKDGFVFGFIGRFSKPKGLIPFLSKVIDNRDLLDDARLVLVGDGEDMKTLRRMAVESGLTRRIVFAGDRDDALEYLRGFDVLVLPSISEGLPMVILEAMSAAKPVLAFDVGSVAEALRNGVNGYLVEAGDYDAFIRHMRRLKECREELVALGRNGRALLDAEFGMDRYMREIEELYRGLARNAGAEGPPC